jgi:hypothetical protein
MGLERCCCSQQQIPGAELRLLHGEAHISLVANRSSSMLSELLGNVHRTL